MKELVMSSMFLTWGSNNCFVQRNYFTKVTSNKCYVLTKNVQQQFNGTLWRKCNLENC